MKTPPSYLEWIRPSLNLMWSCLVYYVILMSIYPDTRVDHWVTSFGLSAFVGCVLLASVYDGPDLRSFATKQPYVTARSYVIPFFVSSFASMATVNGFFMIFPRKIAPALGSIAGAVLVYAMLTYAFKCGSGHPACLLQESDDPASVDEMSVSEIDQQRV